MDARNKKSLKKIDAIIDAASQKKRERDRKRGILNRPVRVMVGGIPNAGKSSFINSYAGKASAKTGNKPGVTRGKQWIRMRKDVELLDTPGVLWPKFEKEETGFHLACIGSISDDRFEKELLAEELMAEIEANYPNAVKSYYNFECDDIKCYLNKIAESRNFLQSGGSLNVSKAAFCLVDDFRAGRLGRISLEKTEPISVD